MLSTTEPNPTSVDVLYVPYEYKRTDAVLDRVCQAAHRIAMKGSSMRKRQPGPASEGAGQGQ